jgi:peptidoglycan DL-endopeptidase CwlO
VPHRHHTRGVRRLPRLVVALGVAAAVSAGAATAGATPTPVPPPSVGDHIRAVNAELDKLSRQSAQLDEQYNVAASAVTAAQARARAAQQAAELAATRARVAHTRFVQAVTQQVETGPSLSMAQLLTSTSPQQYVDHLVMDQYASSQFAATVQAERVLGADTARASQRAAARLATARAAAAALADRRAGLRQQWRRFQQLLATLTAKQQSERAHARAVATDRARAQLGAHPASTRGSAPPPVSGPVSGSVQRVIAFAEAQVGKSYSYGAAGPYSYDCSGLTMAAWARAGVHLPHSAAEQYNYGRHVSYGELQPGDLIFLYSPIGHVELYVGHDLAVSAANPSTGIVYVHPSQDMGSYVGATRLSG